MDEGKQFSEEKEKKKKSKKKKNKWWQNNEFISILENFPNPDCSPFDNLIEPVPQLKLILIIRRHKPQVIGILKHRFLPGFDELIQIISPSSVFLADILNLGFAVGIRSLFHWDSFLAELDIFGYFACGVENVNFVVGPLAKFGYGNGSTIIIVRKLFIAGLDVSWFSHFL